MRRKWVEMWGNSASEREYQKSWKLLTELNTAHTLNGYRFRALTEPASKSTCSA
jgi:hypothetical protein